MKGLYFANLRSIVFKRIGECRQGNEENREIEDVFQKHGLTVTAPIICNNVSEASFSF